MMGWKDPLEKGKATHSSILAWRIPWLYSPWGRKKSVTTKWLSLHLEKNGKFTTELLLGFIYFYFYLLLPKSFLCIFQHYAKIFLVIGSHAMGLILGETVYLGIKESARLEAQGLWRQSWRRKLFCHFRGGHVFPLCPFSFKKNICFSLFGCIGSSSSRDLSLQRMDSPAAACGLSIMQALEHARLQ